MEIKQYLSIIFRRWWLIALAALVTGLAAFLVGFNSTPIYAASARLLLDEPPGSSASEYNQLLLEQRLALTYAEIIEMRTVLEGTIASLDLPFTPGQLKEMIAVSALRDTKIIDIRVEDTDPRRAAAIANSIGRVFIVQNQEREALRYADPVANWEERITTLSRQVEELQADLNNLESAAVVDPAGLLLLEAQIADLQSRHGDAVDNLNNLLSEQARQSSNIVLLEEAQPNSTPIRPQVIRTTILAAFVGALVGLGLIFLIEYLDDTVKDPEQIRLAVDLPTLGTVAIIKYIRGPGKLVAHEQPRAPNSEAYRTLRTNLNFAAFSGEMNSLLITSPSPTDGKSTTAANLAIVFAQTGKEVIIVDADLRRPVQHKFFDLNNEIGLTTAFLDRESNIRRHIRKTHVSHLRLLASGPLPPNPAELLGSQRLDELHAALLQEADILIFDSPPVLSVTDAAVLAAKVSGCLFVVKARQTKELALIEAVDRLDNTGGNVLGVVVNMAKRGRGYYYYYDQKKYDLNGQGESGEQNGRVSRLLPTSSKESQ